MFCIKALASRCTVVVVDATVVQDWYCAFAWMPFTVTVAMLFFCIIYITIC